MSVLCVYGINYRTCPLSLRESFAVSGEELEQVLKRVHNLDGVKGVVILSTCNRTEFYLHCDKDYMPDPIELFNFIKELGRQAKLQEDHIYRFFDQEAIHHLLKVTCGLDSMVLGEPQITGQVKQALFEAKRINVTSGALNRLFEYSFKVTKEVRSTTGIGKGAVSVGYVAVELARKIFGKLKNASLLLVGVGEIGEATAKNLYSAGATRCVVTNRTYHRAVEVADRYGWQARPFDELEELLQESDIAVIAVGAGRYILTHELVSSVVSKRRGRYLFLVDLGVPRAIEPTVKGLDNVFLYDIDDVEHIIYKHIEQRQEEAQAANDIINQRVEKAWEILSGEEIRNLLAELNAHVEKIREAEVSKSMSALSSKDPEEVVEALSKSIVAKLMRPIYMAVRVEKNPLAVDFVKEVLLGQKDQGGNKA